MGKPVRRKKIRTVLTVLLGAVFVFNVIVIVRQQIDYRENKAAAQEAQELVKLSDTFQLGQLSGPGYSFAPGKDSELEPEAGLGPGSEPELISGLEPGEEESEEELAEPPSPYVQALMEIDLEPLREVNGDVVGWIGIPDTELSYPLLKGEDNKYYLSHIWNKEYNSGGSVFLRYTDSSDLSDFHTIAYAHRMNDDTMFGSLRYYEEPDYWQEHPSIYVANETAVYRYDIFAAFEASVEGLVYRIKIARKEEFIQYCLDSSTIDTGIIPEPEDRILTLSTCTENGYANRWVVQGCLVQVYDVEE